MAFINVSEDFVSVAVGGFVFCLKKSENDIKIASYITRRIEESKTAENEFKSDETDIVGSTEVLASTVNYSNNILAVCNSSKHLLLFDMNTLNLLKTISLEKQATSLGFCHFSEKILVADRAGFVIEFDTKSNQQNSSIILGHVSMLFDLVISSNDKHVVTCDRDEKIRISRFPNAYHIESYCLGHKQYVRSLCFIKFSEDMFLASGGGDGLLIIWNYLDGTLINSFDCAQYTIEESCRVKKVVPVQFQSAICLIVIFEQSSSFLCIKLVRESIESIKFVDHKILDLENHILDVDVYGDSKFLILSNCDKPLKSFQILIDEFIISQIELKIAENFNFREQFLTAFSNLNINSQRIVFDIAKERVERKKIKTEDVTKSIV